jgi:hypothetical protein
MRRHTRWLVPSVAVLGLALAIVAWHLAVALPPHEDDRAAALLKEAGNAGVNRVSRPTPGAVLGGGICEGPGDITSVSFFRSAVTREQLVIVSGLRRCQSVGFSRVTFPDPSGLELLGDMPRLTGLDFSHNSVTDEVVTRHLARLPDVQYLMLQDNPLTDGCIDTIAGLPSRQRVDVRGTRITPDGVARLRRLRPEVEVDLTTPGYP